MEKVYMVIADYSSDVSYGFDSASYLCGIYKTEDEANKRAEALKESVKQCHAELDDYYERSRGKSFKELEEMYNKGDSDEALYEKYKDILGFNVRGYMDDSWGVDIIVNCVSFGDLADCFLGGGAYAE